MRREAAVAHPIRIATCLVVTGLALTLIAAMVARTAVAAPRSKVGQPPAPPAGPGPLLLRGPGDVSVATVVYEPGQSSGWHTHGGLHAVAVLSGELTVYDRSCRPQRVAPGAPYVGGQELHLARNDTPQSVEMIVTYLNAATPSGVDGARQDAPADCSVT